MSTTIKALDDTKPADARRPGRIVRAGRFCAAVLGVLAVWLCALIAIPVVRDAPGQYLVIGSATRRLDAVQATDVQLVSAGPGYTQIATTSPGRIAQLYAHGAWLVLPAGKGGCMRLSDWQSLQAK